MDIYDAIVKAADHIERHPDSFDFGQAWLCGHDDPRPSGCPLVWIGRVAGLKAKWAWEVAAHFLGCSEAAFFLRMDDSQRMDGPIHLDWRISAPGAAQVLRRYAVTHHRPAVITEV